MYLIKVYSLTKVKVKGLSFSRKNINGFIQECMNKTEYESWPGGTMQVSTVGKQKSLNCSNREPVEGKEKEVTGAVSASSNMKDIARICKGCHGSCYQLVRSNQEVTDEVMSSHERGSVLTIWLITNTERSTVKYFKYEEYKPIIKQLQATEESWKIIVDFVTA